jgi:peptide/nickel transport system permease protein
MSEKARANTNEASAVASPALRQVVWRRLRKDKFALAALCLIGLLFAISFFAPIIANDKPILMRWQGRLYVPAVADLFPLKYVIKYPELRQVDYRQIRAGETAVMLMPICPYSPYETNIAEKIAPPSRRHWMGTDNLGRDVFSRMVHGAGVSLKVGLVAVGIALIIGLLAGSLAGFYGGVVDIVISRIIEVVMCFPVFFLILAVIAFLPPSIYNIMIVIGITRWTGIARYARGEFLRIKKQDFAHAARALGASDRKIIFRHILPNSIAPVLVSATFGIANAILIEAALSFLGMGIQPPQPSWGGILALARDMIDIAWWLATFPGLAIFFTVTAYNLLGEGLRDASDPRLTLNENR